jgi:hypothetical protein
MTDLPLSGVEPLGEVRKQLGKKWKKKKTS